MEERNRPNVTMHSKTLVVVAPIIAACVLIYMLMARDTFHSFGEGDHVYVESPVGRTYVAVSKQSWDALLDTFESNDSMGRASLIMSGSVFTVPNGTKCLILKLGWETTQVRVLEGTEMGKSGYTLKKLLSKNP